MSSFTLNIDSLERHVGGMLEMASTSRTRVMEDTLEAAKVIANESTRWTDLAEYLDMYDENDRFYIGIRTPQFISEAMAAEYGTEEYPPEPLLRQLDGAARDAAARHGGVVSSRQIERSDY